MSIQKISTVSQAHSVHTDLLRDQLRLLAIVERVGMARRHTAQYWAAVEDYRMAEDRLASFDDCMKALEVGGWK